MNADTLQAWARILDALAWPTVIVLISPVLALITYYALKRSDVLRVKAKGFEFEFKPVKGLRPPSAAVKPADNKARALTVEQIAELTKDESVNVRDRLPPDYLFLNHTSFLLPGRQAEYQKRTGIMLDHYNIHVVLDSYYKGALDQVDRVEYILHRAYPNPIQVRINRDEKFLLKELANGEYVLKAKVFLSGIEQPLLVTRYITLWTSGPRLP